MRRAFTLLLTLALLFPACARPRQYELKGQVLVVDRARGELTIKHEDIRGFMPAMTMPFKVRNARLLDGREPGELVTATLVVEDADAYLSAVTSTGHAPLTEPPPSTSAGPIIAPGEDVPDVEFIDQDGHRRRLSDWRGRVVAVTFIYTRCPLPNFCPLMDRHFAAVQRVMPGDDALRGRAQLLSVSFDPQFDTPAVLEAHAKASGADPATWRFVTGERGAIDAFAGRFGVSIIREDADLKEIVHNLRTAVIDPRGRLVTMFSGNEWLPADLLDAMRRAAR